MSRIHRVQTVVRKTGIIELVRHSVRSQTDRGWPTCHDCINKFNGHAPGVDAVELVDSNATSVTILGRHHDKEDAIRIDWERPYTEDDLSNAWRALTFFHPEMGQR